MLHLKKNEKYAKIDKLKWNNFFYSKIIDDSKIFLL